MVLKRKFGLAALFWGLGLLLPVGAAAWPEGTEAWFSRTFYGLWAQIPAWLFGWLPFSVAEFSVLVALLLGLFGLIFFVWRLVSQPEDRSRRSLSALASLLMAAGALLLLFQAGWGLNYYRPGLLQTEGWTAQAVTEQDLQALADKLVKEINVLRPGLPEDKGVSLLMAPVDTLPVRARALFDRLAKQSPRDRLVLGGHFSLAKAVSAADVLASLGISGIFFPFTGEANFNNRMPAVLLPQTVCHEMGHQRGWAREDEANFVAFQACYQATDPDFRYSGLILALRYTADALAKTNAQAAEQLWKTVDAGVLRDFKAVRAYFGRFDQGVMQAAQAVNNAYLKANRQADGVLSYGRVVDLLVAWNRSGGF